MRSSLSSFRQPGPLRIAPTIGEKRSRLAAVESTLRESSLSQSVPKAPTFLRPRAPPLPRRSTPAAGRRRRPRRSFCCAPGWCLDRLANAGPARWPTPRAATLSLSRAPQSSPPRSGPSPSRPSPSPRLRVDGSGSEAVGPLKAGSGANAAAEPFSRRAEEISCPGNCHPRGLELELCLQTSSVPGGPCPSRRNSACRRERAGSRCPLPWRSGGVGAGRPSHCWFVWPGWRGRIGPPGRLGRTGSPR
jgi:hypothetical protein